MSKNTRLGFAIFTLATAGLVVALAFYFGLRNIHNAGWSLAINTALAKKDPMYKGLERFKERVETRSKGRVKIRLFVGSQLGKDENVLEQARAGANVAVLVDGGRLAVFTPELGILGAPYIANGFPDARKIVTSPLFAEWEADLREASNHQILSFNWWQGDRHLLTNKPIALPEDLNGLRIRTPGAPVWMETIRSMGGSPTPLGWTEIYPALQQKVIDGAESQHPGTYESRFYEVISHITKTSHINLITGLVCSATWFDSLPDDLQVIVREEALAAGDYASKLTEDSLADYEARMRAAGVTITEIDKRPFYEASKEAYEELGYVELRKTIDALLNKEQGSNR